MKPHPPARGMPLIALAAALAYAWLPSGAAADDAQRRAQGDRPHDAAAGPAGPGISPSAGALIDKTRGSQGTPPGDTAGDVAQQPAQGSRPSSAQTDAAITAAVKQEIAKDPQLNTMAIDVQTSGGRVSLTGQAPSAPVRDRLGQLASTVRGVTMVDNRVMVAP